MRAALAQLTQHRDHLATGRPAPEPCSYEAAAADIRQRYGAAMDAAHRSNKSREEIEGIIRALMERQHADLSAMRARRKLAKAQPA